MVSQVQWENTPTVCNTDGGSVRPVVSTLSKCQQKWPLKYKEGIIKLVAENPQ